MKFELSSTEELKHRLLDVQVVAINSGLLIRRGAVRCFVSGPGLEGALSVLVSQATKPEGVVIDRLVADQPVEIRGPLKQLAEILEVRRLLVPSTSAHAGNGRHAEHEEVFYWNYSTTAAIVEKNLGEKTVSIVGVNTISLPLADLLRRTGLREVTLVDHPLFRHLPLFDEKGEPLDPRTGQGMVPFAQWQDQDSRPNLLMALSDFGGLSLMREWNEFSLNRSIPFLPVVLQENRIYLGPFVVPGESACFECFWLRQNANMDEPALLRATDGSAFQNQRVAGFLPAMSLCAAGFAAMEVTKLLSQTLLGGKVGVVIEIDMMEPRITRRQVLKLPRCPVCSRAAQRPTPTPDISVFMPGNKP